MKKILLLILLSLLGFSTTQAQNAIVGTGFSTGWGDGCSTNNSDFNFLTASVGGTYILNTIANGTGNQFWRFGIDWAGTIAQRTITIGSDEDVDPGIKYNLDPTCTTSGAMRRNVASTSYNYVFKTLNAGSNPTGTFVMFEVQGDIRSISTVTRNHNNVIAGDSVVVTATLNGALSAGQAVFLRYTNDGYATSTVVKLTGSGTTYSGAIPRSINAYNANISYYLFTSGDVAGISGADSDLYTINLNNNSGINYSYSVGLYRVSPTLPKGSESVALRIGTNGTGFASLTANEEIYVHMGAMLRGAASTTWDVVKGNWGQGDGVGLLTKINQYQWELNFKPNLYFATNDIDPNNANSNPDESSAALTFDSTAHRIFRLGMVFRNTSGNTVVKSNGFNTGSDIYYNLDPEFWLLLSAPNQIEKNITVDLANEPDLYAVAGTTNNAANISIKDNVTPEFTASSATSFSHNVDLAALGFGVHKIEIRTYPDKYSLSLKYVNLS